MGRKKTSLICSICENASKVATQDRHNAATCPWGVVHDLSGMLNGGGSSDAKVTCLINFMYFGS